MERISHLEQQIVIPEPRTEANPMVETPGDRQDRRDQVLALLQNASIRVDAARRRSSALRIINHAFADKQSDNS